MRTTIDIPDPIYRKLKMKAADEGRTVKSLLLEAAIVSSSEKPIPTRRAKLPMVKTKRTDKVHMTHQEIYEHAGLA